MPRVSAVLALIRDEGILNLPRVAFESLRLLDFHIFVINRGELREPLPVPEGVTMYADALDRLKRAREKRTDLSNEFWRDQMSGASHCATLELNGELGGVVWAYVYPAERPLIVLVPGEAELSTSYTVEEFRGRGLYRALLWFATEWQLRERPRLFTIVASNNPTPLKAVYQVGFHEVGVIRRRAISGPKFSIAKMKAGR
ncbi:GNAT family N-acetyltransferase [Candidatus Binatus sp.]|jgi:GNAT superfamily N-acetyltransferase|uniref:GNAT family N-acetyltransferase n=1 Tax=Candidatus Binatus sp. TaxID=2811406 RepID=UPI003BC67DAB